MENAYGTVFSQVADSIETGLMLLDSELKVVALNSWISERVEFEVSASLGKHVADVFGLSLDSRFVFACEQTVNLGTPAVLSNRLNPTLLPLRVQSGQERVPISQTIKLKRIKQGNDFYCIAWIDDVTAAVLREQTLKHLAEENELARARAEKDSQMKSEFLATMSHEIRTPMNGVLGMLGLLAQTELTKRQEHFVSLANSSANSLLHVINDILDFSKIEADRIDLEEFDFDLETLFSEIAHGMVIRAKEKDLELVLDLVGLEHRFVKGDPGRIRQILNNLVGNAIKFTERGEVSIKASLKVNGDIAQLICEIADTGIGIPEDRIEQLFEPFSQQDASTTRKYGGTGLGLSIAKRLCGLMDGHVTCQSKLGTGSTFRFELKLAPADTMQLVQLPEIDLQGLKALVVDDNETNLVALENQLVQWGVEVVAARSGHQALEILLEKGPAFFDVGILDMLMPRMDGAMLCEEIHKLGGFEDLPLIMLTSLTSRGDGLFFAELGFSGYLPKPVSPSALRDALKIIIDGGEAYAQARPLVTQHHIASVNKQATKERRRLLVAEDNEINCELIDSLLGETFDLEFAKNGVLALESLREAQHHAPFDAILMDCRMPEMDGYEATRAIRAGIDGITQTDVPIIALTANAMASDRKDCLEAGMNDYLCKPVDPQALEERLDFWLTPGRSGTRSSNC